MNKNKTVVVITDGHEQFAPTATLLLKDGISLRFQHNLSESLMSGAPHLIISELARPDIDGLKLCRRVREDNKFETTQVMLVGDLCKRSSIVKDGFRCGAVEYLQKPIDAVKLADVCRGILAVEKEEPIKMPIGGLNFDDPLQNDLLRSTQFANAGMGIAIFTYAGDFVESNEKLLDLLDYCEVELRDMNLSDFIYPADFVNDKRAIKEVFEGKRQHYRFENGYLTADGTRIWGGLTIGSIEDDSDGSRFLTGIFEEPVTRSHDLTPAPQLVLQNNDRTILDLTRWRINKRAIRAN